jgi:hypothetical protein
MPPAADGGEARDGVVSTDAMLESAINKVVRYAFATSPGQLERHLASLPHGVRYHLQRGLAQGDEAFHYESARHCAHYLRRRGRGVMIWRWSYVASESEAAKLRNLIASLQGEFGSHHANRVFEQATRRTVGNPRPAGLEFHAVDAGDYPILREASAQL